METNKENKIGIRIGIVAVILLLLIALSAVTGITLAKYITSETVSTQTATVAKWGYTLTADTTNLFGVSYGEVDSTTKLAKVSGANTVVAQGSSVGGAIVAPGTTGYMMLKLQGVAEVNAMLTIDVTDFETVTLANGDADGSAYEPLNWTVNDTAVTNGTKSNLATAIASAIEAKVNDGVTVTVSDSKVTVQLPANTDFGVNGIELKISWAWVYSSGSENDKLDTILGQIAANNGIISQDFDKYAGTVYTVSIGLEAAFVQTQE